MHAQETLARCPTLLWFHSQSRVKIIVPWLQGTATGFLTVRSRGASWSAMRSLLRTGLWLCAGLAPTLLEEGAPKSKDGLGRLWSEWGWVSEGLSWGELVFEVYSAANCRIILWSISRATTGMWGSEKFGTSEGEKKDQSFCYNTIPKCPLRCNDCSNLNRNVLNNAFLSVMSMDAC